MATENARGAVFMTVATAGFAVNDTIMKYTFETMPLAQGVFLRGVVATLFVALMAWHQGQLLYRPDRRERRALALRTLGEVGGTAAFMVAIAQMPIAAATAVLQAAPLGVTMAAALVLGEPVGWRRWTAILVGFCGVLLMIRPGADDFNLFAVFALVTVGFVVLRDVSTRAMGPRVPTLFASLITAVSVTAVAGALVPIEGWRALTAGILGLYGAAACFIIVGYVFVVRALRSGELSAVSPFRYAVLLWALVLGLVVFGEIPHPLTLAGAAIVVGAGLYTLWREQVVARRRFAAATSPSSSAPPPPRRNRHTHAE